jgi:hypothetical protein
MSKILVEAPAVDSFDLVQDGGGAKSERENKGEPSFGARRQELSSIKSLSPRAYVQLSWL